MFKTTETNVTTFNSAQFGDLRTHQSTDGIVWFCLNDVMKSLGLSHVTELKKRLQEKGCSSIAVLTNGGNQQMIFIDEPNLYRCIFQSRKAEAEKFQNWVFEEILPTIRKTGGYIATTQEDTPELIMARALQVAQATITKHQQMLEQANERIALQEKEIKAQAPKVSYYDQTLQSVNTLTTTQVAKSIGMETHTLTKKLKEAGIIFKQSGMWMLHAPYSKWKLHATRTSSYTRSDGTTGTNQYTVWTERGRRFIVALADNDFNTSKAIKAIQAA